VSAEPPELAAGMSFEQVRDMLAHRFPFLMIDRVVSVERGKRLQAIRHICGNDICFLGHFPKRAVMPGVLILEAMAQALSLLDRVSRQPDEPAAKYLGRAEVQFLRPVVPGDSLLLEAEIVKQVTIGVFGKVSVSVGGVQVARGEIGLGVGKDEDI
jgi:3-hydroxyacyl-[acyl-carrier-protein] dehydratase